MTASHSRVSARWCDSRWSLRTVSTVYHPWVTEVSTGSGSDRVAVRAPSGELALGYASPGTARRKACVPLDPVATAPGTDSIAAISRQLRNLCKHEIVQFCLQLSKSLPEPDLETEIVVASGQVAARTLLVLGDERHPIGQTIFNCQNLVRI